MIAISLLDRPVGVERYQLRRTAQGFELTAAMDVTERGSRLQVASTLATTADFSPTRFTSKGKSYRFVNVDTDISVTGNVASIANLGATSDLPLPPRYFTATSYVAAVGTRGPDSLLGGAQPAFAHHAYCRGRTTVT